MWYRRRGCWRAPFPPPWWPENEPWPPMRRARLYNRRSLRRSVFGRFIAAMAMMMIFWTIASAVLSWIGATAIGAAHVAGARGSPMVSAVIAGGVLIALVLGAVALGSIAEPIDRLVDASERVANGDYGVRVPERGPASARALARSFNTMTERLQSHDRVRRDLMADVAHELRTPLTVIQGKLEGLIDGVYPRDADQLQQLFEETRVLSRLVEDLRTLALSEGGALRLQREPTDLVALSREVAAAFAAEALSRGIALTVDASNDVESVEVDPVRIREVIANLVSNALRHTPEGGRITIRVGSERGAMAVEVRDTGSGMSADDLAHAFDRFYKGPNSRGSGLGLTIARNLVTAHGGAIRASSDPGQGTTFTVTLPRG